MNALSLIITLFIIVVMWLVMFPGIHLSKTEHSPGVEQKTYNQAKQVEATTQQQVDYAKKLEEQAIKKTQENQ